MKKNKIFYVSFSFLMVYLISNAALAGDVVSKQYNISGYDRIEVEFPFIIQIKPAKKHKAVINIDKRLVDRLDVRKHGSTLKIDIKPGSWSDRINGNVTFEAEIYLPRLAGLELNSAAQAVIEDGVGLADTFELKLTGATSVKGSMRVKYARFDITGASSIKFEGGATNMDLDLSGASRAKLTDFVVRDAKVDVSGASIAKLKVTGELDADVSGVSKLFYSGNPRIRHLDYTGMSKVSQL